MKAHIADHRGKAPVRRRRAMPRHRPPLARTSAGSVVYKRILVPVDFTTGSDRALRHAASLARSHRTRILPLHVRPPICFTVDCGYGPVKRTVPDEDSLRRARAHLQRLVHRIVPKKLAENVMVRSGQPTDQIMTVAKEWKADLIIMVVHEVSGNNSVPPTHTVDRLVRQVRCPVLLLHPPMPSRRGPSSNRLLKFPEHAPQPGLETRGGEGFYFVKAPVWQS